LKAHKRQFSFSKWMRTHNKEPKKVLINGSVLDLFYAGAVLLNSHPETGTIHEYFKSELDILERETAKRGEVTIIET
jgi:hypothetical protein